MEGKDNDNDRWLMCGDCDVPVRVSRGRYLTISCPNCKRRLVYLPNGATQPAGGEIDGVPPFLAQRRKVLTSGA